VEGAIAGGLRDQRRDVEEVVRWDSRVHRPNRREHRRDRHMIGMIPTRLLAVVVVEVAQHDGRKSGGALLDGHRADRVGLRLALESSVLRQREGEEVEPDEREPEIADDESRDVVLAHPLVDGAAVAEAVIVLDGVMLRVDTGEQRHVLPRRRVPTLIEVGTVAASRKERVVEGPECGDVLDLDEVDEVGFGADDDLGDLLHMLLGFGLRFLPREVGRALFGSDAVPQEFAVDGHDRQHRLVWAAVFGRAGNDQQQ